MEENYDPLEHQREADKICFLRLERTIRNLEDLADGHVTEMDEELQAAGIITVGTGTNMERPFKDRPPEEMIILRRKVHYTAPDRAANIYLADRVLGKVKDRPTEEGVVSEEVRLAFEADLIRAYGRPVEGEEEENDENGDEEQNDDQL